jgi:hypothetical protein
MQEVFRGPGFVVGLFAGIVLGLIGLWCVLQPQVGRIAGRVLALIALGFGVNWIITPLADLAAGQRDTHYDNPLGNGGFGWALGSGAGAFVVGVTGLVLSFLRTRPKTAAPKEERDAVIREEVFADRKDR